MRRSTEWEMQEGDADKGRQSVYRAQVLSLLAEHSLLSIDELVEYMGIEHLKPDRETITPEYSDLLTVLTRLRGMTPGNASGRVVVVDVSSPKSGRGPQKYYLTERGQLLEREGILGPEMLPPNGMDLIQLAKEAGFRRDD